MLDAVPLAHRQASGFVHLGGEISSCLEARVQLDALEEAGPHSELLVITFTVGILLAAILYFGGRVELVSHVGRVLRLVVLCDVE